MPGKPITTPHSKLKEVITAYETTIEKTLSPIDAQDVFSCLGTTIKKADSQRAFREIDFSLWCRPVEAEKVARFMIKVAHGQPISGVHVHESDLIL